MLATTEHHFDQPDLPMVVLVHGAMDRSSSFRRVVEHLGGYRVVTYDRRGYGDAVEAEPASGLQDHTADLLDVIGDRRATVVAHSVAGHIALLAAIAGARSCRQYRALGAGGPVDGLLAGEGSAECGKNRRGRGLRRRG